MSALEARGIWKAFDGTLALRGVNLSIGNGSIHALIGENGAGKSTLIKILTGVLHPDRGTVYAAEQACSFGGPEDALAAGIAAMYQERNLVPEFSVAENLFLRQPPRRAGFLDYERMFRDGETWLKRVGLDVGPRTRATDLSVAEQQLVEIARALALEAKVLLLDEPTASITQREAGVLFDILRELRDRRSALLFVSHRLDEVFALCDMVTVIRDGQTIINAVARANLTQSEVITAMVGRSISFAQHRAGHEAAADAPLLELRNVTTRFGHEEIRLALQPGRVIGLYGLVGAGRTELAKAIIGIEKIRSGQVLFRGGPVYIRDPHMALHKYRIGYISEDRKREGLILMHPISRNAGITIWDLVKSWLSFITPERELGRVAPVIRKMDVKLSSFDQPVSQLSGGNQQKVSVAKWLVSDVDVLIIDEPTIGIDVRTKEEIYLLIEELASRGKAIMLISSDLPEIIRLSDRILVMANRRLIFETENSGDYCRLSEHVMQAIVSAHRLIPADGKYDSLGGFPNRREYDSVRPGAIREGHADGQGD